MNSGGSFGASPLEQHIGLGRARRIEALEIWWPTSKTRRTFHDVPMRQFVQIKEFDKDIVVLQRRSFNIPFKQEASAPVSAKGGELKGAKKQLMFPSARPHDNLGLCR